MLFETRCHWQPKDLGYEREYEDAYCADAEAGRLAIADGVSSAIFSKSWAALLSHLAVAAPPAIEDIDAVELWLSRLRKQWTKEISYKSLRWMQRDKLQRVGGGSATLLWVELRQSEHDEFSFNYEVVAFGDCCLFHIRDNQLLHSFPMTDASQFDLTPDSLRSFEISETKAIECQMETGECREGDFLILTTDAFAEWALREEAIKSPVDWMSLWEDSPIAWDQRIKQLRQQTSIRVDDTTIVLARIGRVQSDGSAPKVSSIEDIDVKGGYGEMTTPDLLSILGFGSPENLTRDEIQEASDPDENTSPVAGPIEIGNVFEEEGQGEVDSADLESTDEGSINSYAETDPCSLGDGGDKSKE